MFLKEVNVLWVSRGSQVNVSGGSVVLSIIKGNITLVSRQDVILTKSNTHVTLIAEGKVGLINVTKDC